MADAEKSVEKKLIDQKVEDLAGHRALAEPFPGPLKDAFALAPDIQVGPFKVRRFVDGDWRILASLNHPFGEFLKLKLLGDETSTGGSVDFVGPKARQLAYVFTRPAKEVRDLLREKGVDELDRLAEEEFEEMRIAGFAEIAKAIMVQAQLYATANIEYGEKPKEGEKSPNPPSSEAPLTA